MVTTSTTTNETGAQWLSVAVVAARLGVSPRAIQKRCARGTLPARRVEGERGEVWEVEASALSANSEPLTANHEREPKTNANTVRTPRKASPATKQGGPDGEPQREPRTFESERERELKEEVRFLRGIVEQLQRDGAETRAALRKALDNNSRQLVAPGAQSGQELSGKVTVAAPSDTTSGQLASARNSSPERQESAPSTYAELADLLEKQLGG